MQSAFLDVVIAVAAIGVIGAVVTLLARRSTWEALGRDRLLMESDLRDPRARAPSGPASAAPAAETATQAAERDAEIRQMLEARNRRRRRRGEGELDVDAELTRLTRAPLGGGSPTAGDGSPTGAGGSPTAGAGSPTGAGGSAQPHEELDSELLAEVRQLVLARNHRRVRRGRPPLDVDAEIARQIARLKG